MSDIWFPRTYPRANREHMCVTCYRTIDKGERYVRGSGIWYGSPTSWKQCAHCDSMLDRIDYDEEFCEDDYDSFEPRDIPELRALVHYRRKWRNSAGSLYPVPFIGQTS